MDATVGVTQRDSHMDTTLDGIEELSDGHCCGRERRTIKMTLLLEGQGVTQEYIGDKGQGLPMMICN